MNDKHIKKIIDKQFKIANLDLKYEDICDNQTPNWHTKYTYSPEDNEKWKNWTMRYMREKMKLCLLYTSPSPRDLSTSRMPSSA